jgi:adenosine deaminase
VAELARTAVRFRDLGLTGWDLAGTEAAFPDPLVFERAFAIAREGGLHVTIHAGEWGGAAQVRRALAVNPERIAHGPGAIDEPALMAELIAREITLDLCPTSNVQAGIVPSVAAHPIARLARAGVPVSLSTDGLTVSDTLLSEEYLRALTETGLSLGELWSINLHGLDVAFISSAERAELRRSFERWAANIPELAGGRPGSGNDS